MAEEHSCCNGKPGTATAFNPQHVFSPFDSPPMSGPSSGPNAPPPSSCESNHSGSACPSPGPIKRFRQLYGGAQTASQQQPATRRMVTAANWTESWMNTYHGAASSSGCSPCASTTPSVMSVGSAVTRLSALSVDTQLSVSVDLQHMNLDNNNDGPNQLFRFSASSPSCIENVDPCYFQQMRDYLTHILQRLNSMVESLEYEAVYQLYRIGREQLTAYCIEPSPIGPIIKRLVEIILRPNTREKTRSLVLNVLCKIVSAGNLQPPEKPCLTFVSAIRTLESNDRGFFLNAIILCLKSEVENDARYATNILSALFLHRPMGEFFRRQARTQQVIRDLMMVLQQEHYGFRHRFLRHIYYLIKPSKELKRFFHQSNGVHICLDLFRRSIDEPMLYGCASLLLAMIDTSSTMADHFVASGGIQLLANSLDHGSPRLLLGIAQCLSSCSDSDQISHLNIDEAIRLSIQLLASTDGDLVKHIVGFLANVQVKNVGAKQFMQNNNAIPNLMFLLSVWTNSPSRTPAVGPIPREHKCVDEERCDTCHAITQKSGTDELIDTVLLALCNLSNGINAPAMPTCKGIFEYGDDESATTLFLQMLLSNELSDSVRVRLLKLISQLISHCGTALFTRPNCANGSDSNSRKDYAFAVLAHFSGAIQRFTANQQKGVNDKMARQISTSTLYILSEFAKQPLLLESLISLIRGTNWNPFLLVCSLRYEKMETSLMEFLCQLSSAPEILVEWLPYSETLRYCSNLTHLVPFVSQIFNRLVQRLNLSNNTGCSIQFSANNA